MVSAPASLERVRPLHPSFMPETPREGTGIVTSISMRMRKLAIAAVDRGWLGCRPLKTHVVVCGFPRSGSTLLHLMIEACVSGVRTFGTELEALVAARYALRNHEYMFTKDPDDVFYLDKIRAYYAGRRAQVRFIVTVRDPRAVLTSVHQGHPMSMHRDGYWIDPARWDAYHEHVRYARQFDDVLTVEYEDTIRRPAELQRRLEDFTGWKSKLSFENFHTAVPRKFAAHGALNGLRPLDATRVAAWKQEKQRARIVTLLREIPRLPDYLIEMGYESDASWSQEYLEHSHEASAPK
jgi:hypothetical protein